MSKLTIRVFGDPVLRQKAMQVTTFDDKLAQLAQDMLTTMRDAPGVGLAANQVGVLKRLFTWEVTEYEWDDEGNQVPGSETVEGGVGVCNPVLADADDEDVLVDDEGCLSFPNLFYPVERPRRIAVDWQDVHGETHTTQLEGFNARVWLHEMDHLDGILFIDHLARHDQREARRLMREYREEHDLGDGDMPRGGLLLGRRAKA